MSGFASGKKENIKEENMNIQIDKNRMKKNCLKIGVSALLVVLIVGSVSVLGNPSQVLNTNAGDEPKNKYYGGNAVEESYSEGVYRLIDEKRKTILYINESEIERGLDGDPVIDSSRALQVASEFCGNQYTLARITENKYDFDILYKRYLNNISILGDSCYVSINKMTGEISAFRKLPSRTISPDIANLKPSISEDSILKKTNSIDAKLVIVPEYGIAWVTSKPNSKLFNAVTGEELTQAEIIRIKDEIFRTNISFSQSKGKTIKGSNISKLSDISLLVVDNNQGAVFRDDDDITSDDIAAAEASMEKQRPNGNPAWDSDASNFGIPGSESTINAILGYFEGVYFSGHGNNDCIGMNGAEQYCYWEASNGLQTKVFTVSACNAGNNFATNLNNKGVQCVIGASSTISDGGIWWSECANWADIFWDKATGNIDAGSQRSAHTARVETNAATLFNWCDLDTEKGDCNTYI
ncbi:MAG: hypothetical protein KJ714_00030 [Euryarchaeota archaeon]|nr:hypothetical protein [Euryarchaeota archaeon]